MEIYEMKVSGTQRSTLQRIGISIVSIAIAAMIFAMSPATARADSPLGVGSLELVPADADVYSCIIGAGELVEKIGESNAWEKLMSLPQVGMLRLALMMTEGDPSSPMAPIHAMLKDPDFQDATQLVGDAFSEEFFIYGDQGSANLLKLYNETQISSTVGLLILGATGYVDMNDSEDVSRMQKVLMLAQLSENLHLLEMPNVVLGFKLSDTELAEAQIAKLESLLMSQVKKSPIKTKVRRASIAGTEYLTIVIRGKSLPWDQIPTELFEEFEIDEGDLEKVIEHIKKQNLVICLGIRGDYLLLSIGSSTKSLRALGQGPSLATLPEIKKLEQHADENIFTIGYTSAAFNQTANDPLGQFQVAADTAKEILAATDIDADLRDRIIADIDKTMEGLRSLVPEPQAMAGICFLTDEGIESYNYNWAVQATLDGSKPLTILGHIGGDPMLAIASRSKDSEKEYDVMAQLLSTVYGYAREFGVPSIPDKKGREQLETFLEKIDPLLTRLDKANRELLLPALADGQGALVVDLKLKSRQFFPDMPRAAKALPMFEPAMVITVSDREKLEKAIDTYWATVNEALAIAQEIDLDDPPPIKELPKPQVTEEDGITFYTYPLPEEWGLDAKIAPCIALTDDLVVFAVSFEHAKRLLAETECKSGGVLTDTSANRAIAWVFNWEALIKGASKWARYAISQQFGEGEQPAVEQMAWDSVRPILEILAVPKTATGEVTIEGDVMVSHTLVEFEDCDPPETTVPAGAVEIEALEPADLGELE